jgi:Uma2 family endonuclease
MLDVPLEDIRPITRAEYEELAGAGRFDDERVELLYGVIVKMTPPRPPHEGLIQRLTRLFVLALDPRAAVRIQSTLFVSDVSLPQPDLAIVPPGDYLDEHPTVAWLVVEVADSSLRKDTGVKARLYAECGVPEYWVVDVKANEIEVRTQVVEGRYMRITRHGKGERIVLVKFPDVVIPTDHVLV